MSRTKPLPVDDTIRLFYERKISARTEVVNMVRKEIWSSNAAKLLISELSEEAIKQGMSNPTDFMALTFTYGVAIGILCKELSDNRRIITL